MSKQSTENMTDNLILELQNLFALKLSANDASMKIENTYIEDLSMKSSQQQAGLQSQVITSNWFLKTKSPAIEDNLPSESYKSMFT